MITMVANIYEAVSTAGGVCSPHRPTCCLHDHTVVRVLPFYREANGLREVKVTELVSE